MLTSSASHAILPHRTTPAILQARLLRRGLWLEYATLGGNVVGCGIVLAAAWLARSVALAGFGLDSVIEIVASVVVVWQLRGSATRRRERRALRLIGLAFFGLVVYILAQSAYTLLAGTRPEPSPGGIVWLALTFLAMLALVLNTVLGWWWADPLVGLVIVYSGVREGLHAWHGD